MMAVYPTSVADIRRAAVTIARNRAGDLGLDCSWHDQAEIYISKNRVNNSIDRTKFVDICDNIKKASFIRRKVSQFLFK